MKMKMKMKTKKLITYKIKDAYTYMKLRNMYAGIAFFREEVVQEADNEYFIMIPKSYSTNLINNNLITKI